MARPKQEPDFKGKAAKILTRSSYQFSQTEPESDQTGLNRITAARAGAGSESAVCEDDGDDHHQSSFFISFPDSGLDQNLSQSPTKSLHQELGKY